MKWFPIAILLVAAPAFAGPADVAVRVDFVEQRQVCYLTGCRLQWQVVSVARGSGVVVSKNESALAILTNAHVIADDPQHPRARKHVYLWVENRWRLAEKIGEDVQFDLALLSVAYSGSVRPVTVALNVTHQEPVTSHAYVGGMRYRQQRGTIAAYLDGKSGIRSYTHAMTTSIKFAEGESGGGVYNDKGQLVGLVTGNDTHPQVHDRTGRGIVVDVESIHKFLKRHIARYRQQPPKVTLEKPVGPKPPKVERLTPEDEKQIAKSVDETLNGMFRRKTQKTVAPKEQSAKQPAKVDVPAEEKKRGIPSWLITGGMIAATAAGVGIPSWLIGGYRAAKAAKAVVGTVHDFRHRNDTPEPPATPEPPTQAGSPEHRAANPAYYANAVYPQPVHNIHYKNVPPTDNLLSMREAMKLVTDEYPAGRGWVKLFEDAYKVVQSGKQQQP